MDSAIMEGNLRGIMQRTENLRSWVKGNKEVFTIVIAIAGAAVWMTQSLHNLERDLTKEIISIRREVTLVKEELIKIETVLILKGIAPAELFSVKED